MLNRTLVLGAGMHALFGVVHSQLLNAFDTGASKRQQAARVVNKRKRDGASSGGADEVDEQVRQWDVTSFFKPPQENRWRIIAGVRRNYHDLCVLVPKKKEEEHGAAKVERYKAARATEVEKCLNRAAK